MSAIKNTLKVMKFHEMLGGSTLWDNEQLGPGHCFQPL